jgi:hypothetical protein
MAERQSLLMAERLLEADVGVRVKVDGTEELGHVRWARRVKALALAVPDQSGLLISAVRAQMPNILKDRVGNSHATWEAFANAVCTVSLLDIEEAKEKEARLRRIEQSLQPPTPSLLSAFNRLALSTPNSATTTTQIPATPNIPRPRPPVSPGTPFIPSAPPRSPRTIFRSDDERLADAERNRLPHHPPTSEGLSKYKAQVVAWTAANPSGRPNEHRPYPLTPGTMPVGSGECWKCGLAGHRGDNDPGTNLVPDLEATWRRIAGGIYSRANASSTTSAVHAVGAIDEQTISWLTSDAYKDAIIAHYLEQQGNALGPST